MGGVPFWCSCGPFLWTPLHGEMFPLNRSTKTRGGRELRRTTNRPQAQTNAHRAHKPCFDAASEVRRVDLIQAKCRGQQGQEAPERPGIVKELGQRDVLQAPAQQLLGLLGRSFFLSFLFWPC